MTTVHRQKIARRELTLLQLAQALGSVSKACRIVGSAVSSSTRSAAYQVYGAEGLIDRLPEAWGPHPKRVSTDRELFLGADWPWIRSVA